MATYIALVNYTDQGVRQIRQTTERAKALINAAANLGVKIKDIYWTMGGFDAVFIADFTHYEPAKGSAAAFIATPIFDGPRRLGVFAMRLSPSEIDRAVSGNRGWKRGRTTRRPLPETAVPHVERPSSMRFPTR